jgi:hypothetical protein
VGEQADRPAVPPPRGGLVAAFGVPRQALRRVREGASLTETSIACSSAIAFFENAATETSVEFAVTRQGLFRIYL